MASTSACSRAGVFVDPVDAGAGEDVVELMEQERFHAQSRSGRLSREAATDHSSAARRPSSARRLASLTSACVVSVARCASR